MPTNDKAVCRGFLSSPAHLQEFSSRGSHCYNAIKTNPKRASSVIMLLCVQVYSYFVILLHLLTFNLNKTMGNQVFIAVPNDS